MNLFAEKIPLPQLILLGLVSLVVLINTLFEQSLVELLPYERELIAEGEYWRMLSGHFMHLTWGHLWMNLAGLIFIFYFFGSLISATHWAILIFFSGMFISIVLYFTQPTLHSYVGLSGVLHGLFIAGGIADLKPRRKEAILFLIFIIGKLLYEQIQGPLPGSEESAGGPVLVDAHFYGGVAGGIYMLGVYAKQYLRKTT